MKHSVAGEKDSFRRLIRRSSGSSNSFFAIVEPTPERNASRRRWRSPTSARHPLWRRINRQNFTEYVPMLWGFDYDHTSAWNDDASSWIDAGSKHLLAFNEPENVGQSNISPTAAADAYRQYMEPFAGRAQLGAPGVSNDGRDWMKQFLSLCSECTIDFVPIHWVRSFHELFSLSSFG